MNHEVTRLLQAIEQGEPQASNQLFLLVYDELRTLAARQMAQESPGHTLAPTALVHEAYLRLGPGNDARWENRAHFFGAAAEAMRRILVESARRRRSQKRGGQLARRELSEELPESGPSSTEQLLDLNTALTALEKMDPAVAEVVKLRYFAGFSVEQTATILNVSPRTVKRDWSFAKAWLQREMERR